MLKAAFSSLIEYTTLSLNCGRSYHICSCDKTLAFINIGIQFVTWRLMGTQRDHWQADRIRRNDKSFPRAIFISPIYTGGSYVLKGAYLLTNTLEDQTYRTTKEIGLLKIGDTDREYILESIKNICTIQYPEDTVKFDTEKITLQDIREPKSRLLSERIK